jgi:hypothetical protein
MIDEIPEGGVVPPIPENARVGSPVPEPKD